MEASSPQVGKKDCIQAMHDEPKFSFGVGLMDQSFGGFTSISTVFQLYQDRSAVVSRLDFCAGDPGSILADWHLVLVITLN